MLERHERATQHCQRVIDVARATGQGGVLMTTMTAQAWTLIRMGRLDEAEETLAAATQAGYLAPHLFFSFAVGLSSLLATYRGDYDAAVDADAEAVRLARTADRGGGGTLEMSGWLMANALLEAGEPRRAREILIETNRGSDVRMVRTGAAATYEVLARADLALGRVDAAQAWADKAVAATHGWQLGVEAAFARRAQAAVALARGDAAAAASLAMDGGRGADDAGAPVEAGRCRILAAQALVQAGRRADALAELENAAEQLARVGAHGYLAQAEKGLHRLRGRSGRRTSDPRAIDEGMRSLTERERDVAELVGRGRAVHLQTSRLLDGARPRLHKRGVLSMSLRISARCSLATRVSGC